LKFIKEERENEMGKYYEVDVDIIVNGEEAYYTR
jgi:hypothetical protein